LIGKLSFLLNELDLRNNFRNNNLILKIIEKNAQKKPVYYKKKNNMIFLPFIVKNNYDRK